jgi:transcriptional regulator with XRE-family HTH domain
MTARNQLLRAPPYPVEKALTQLGENLRTARIRRNFTIDEVAQKIGTGRRAVMDAEKGKASTGVGAYIALLWVYNLLPQLNDVANPAKDEQGLALAAPKKRTRARKGGELDNDF